MSQKETTVGFLGPGPSAGSLEQGITCRRILSENGPSYRSETGRKAVAPWISSPSAPSPTRRDQLGRPNGSIKPSWRNGLP